METRPIGWSRAGQQLTRRRFLASAGYLAGGVVLANALNACTTCESNGMPTPLTDSPHLVPVPAITDNKVELTPELYDSWSDMFEDNDTKLDYLLAPGDYQGWGVLEFSSVSPSLSGFLKTVRYYNPGVDDTLHPVLRYPVLDPVTNAALVASVRFEESDTKNWFVHGLTIISPTANPGMVGGASKITVDFCLIERARRFGFRIRHATDCTIQRCVIRETTLPDRDSAGIGVGNIDKEITGIQILDNEIYNFGDCIQLTDSETTPERSVEVVIEGNDLYLEPSQYIDDTTWAENAIDIKAGSDRPDSTIIRSNRMWGFRRNAERSAFGELLVLQKFSRNVVVIDNILCDAPRGMKDEGWPPDTIGLSRPRNIEFRNNQFCDIRDYAAADIGAIIRPITARIAFINNYFARSDYLADQTPPAYQGDVVFRDNVLVEIGNHQRTESRDPPFPYDINLNTETAAPCGFESYQRKRWTGPEVAVGAVPLSHE